MPFKTAAYYAFELSLLYYACNYYAQLMSLSYVHEARFDFYRHYQLHYHSIFLNASFYHFITYVIG